MNSIDLSPLYRSSIGFDGLASLLNSALRSDNTTSSYPPYNIEVVDDNKYTITLAVAGFEQSELDITVDNSVLTIRGEKAKAEEHKYLYQGIANRAFERKFNLADFVEVKGAQLNNGLLTIHLVKEVPEAMKPKTIAINDGSRETGHTIEHSKEESTESQSANAA